MKTSGLLVLLSAVLVLCQADPPSLQSYCTQDVPSAITDLAVQAIYDNHDHGYRFSLHRIVDNSVNQVPEGCERKLVIELKETKCTVTNPKPLNECDVRELHSRPVVSNCTVMLDVKNDVAKVTRYECNTRQEYTNTEMMRICPDCPALMPLNSPEGLKAVHDAIQQFNKNDSNTNLFVLHEVGRVTSYYMMIAGMMYSPSFTLVETRCPRTSRILPAACVPLCPKRAKHAYCNARYSTANGLQSVSCEFYPAEDTRDLAPGEEEPTCTHPHRGPPSNGPPGPPAPPTGDAAPAPPVPPPRPHPHSHVPCHEAKADSDRDIHPICNWPVPQLLLPGQKADESM